MLKNLEDITVLLELAALLCTIESFAGCVIRGYNDDDDGILIILFNS